MTINVEQLMSEAKELAYKLRASESKAEKLLGQAESVHLSLDCLGQYAEAVGKLNETAAHRPHEALVASIQQENRQLGVLQQENRELRTALEEQQSALELIMSKYRQQRNRLASPSPPHQHFNNYLYRKYAQILLDQAFKLRGMKDILEKSAEDENETLLKYDEELRKISTENQRYRKLLALTSSNEIPSQDSLPE